MPFDPNVLIVFGSLLCALALSLAYAVWFQSVKRRDRTPGKNLHAAQSVGVSELQEIVRAAVKDATEPLEARFDSLDARLRALQGRAGAEPRRALSEHDSSAELELPDASDAADTAEQRARARVR